MTLLDKLRETHPDSVLEACGWETGEGCPGDYPELHSDKTCHNCGVYDGQNSWRASKCADCWAQEYKPVTPNQKREEMGLPAVEAVDHPSHYNTGAHECIDEMVALFGVETVKAFCRCNVHKYRYRAQAKNGAEDLKKADWYMSKLMELEGEA